MEIPKLPGPVLIGGAGGSGTRVVAQMLIEAGFYMGNHLNPPLDNLWFTLLFRRPGWFTRMQKRNPARILKGWHIFEKTMTGTLSPGLDELLFVLEAAGHHLIQDLWPGWSLWRMLRRELPATARRVTSLLRSGQIDLSDYTGWGWKAPNTVFYLNTIQQHFADFKYIHVMRHGLDMAFRTKQRQLYNWGHVMGFDANQRNVKASPQDALRFWLKVNQSVIEHSQSWPASRLHIVRLEEMCLSPQIEIRKLLNFLDVEVDKVTFDHMCSLPRLPETANEYKKQDLAQFDPDDLAALTVLGYTIDTRN